MSKSKFTDEQKIELFNKYNEQCPATAQGYHFSHDPAYRALMKVDLVWLYTQLEVKGAESEQRGKPMSDEYKRMIDTVKRASLFITNYSRRMDDQDAALEELKRQNDALRTQFPKFDIKQHRLHWTGTKLVYVKKKPDDPISIFLQPKPECYNKPSV